MDALVDLSRSLGDLHSLDAILEQLLRTTAEQIGAERATFFLWDHSRGELYSRASTGGLTREIRIPDTSGFAGAVFHGGEGLIIDDVTRDARFNPSVDALTGYQTRSLVCVPIRTMSGEIVGVAQALNNKSGAFTDSDRLWLAAMTRRAARFLVGAAYSERAGGGGLGRPAAAPKPTTAETVAPTAGTALSFAEITRALHTLPLFRECPQTDFARFLSQVGERRLVPGEVLYDRGMAADNTYLIVDGECEITTGDGEAAPARHGLLGEEAAIGMDFYVSRVTAVGRARILVLPCEATSELAANRVVREHFLASFNGRLMGFGDRPSRPKSHVKGPGGSWRETIGWASALALPILLYISLRDSGVLPSHEALLMLCTLTATVVMWVFRLLPDFVPALFAVLSVVLLGIAPPSVAFGGFVSDGFYMAMSILGLSAVIRSSGLSYRTLLWLLRTGPGNKAWYNFCLFLIGTVLTPVVPSANGRIAIISPFLVDLLRAVPKSVRTAEAPRLSGSALGGASLVSAIFASSKSVNFVILGMLPLQLQHQFHWFFWFEAAALCGVVVVALYAVASWLLFRNSEGMRIPKELVIEQQRLIGRLKPAEWAGLFGLCILLVGFVSAATHRLDISWIAMAILFCLLMFGFLGENDFRKNIDWSFLVFLGALVGLAAATREVGLETWLTARLGWLGSAMSGDFMIFVPMLAAVIFVIRLALPINATVIVLAGLLIPSAVTHGVNPWVIGFLVLFFAESFIWPYQASYFSQFNSLTGPIAGADDRRLYALNLMTAAFKVLAVFATIPYWRSLGLL